MIKQKVIISVIGGSQADSKTLQLAYKVGQMVAQVGGILVCGGLMGTMEASAKGCKEAGGMTIGILPGKEKADANSYIDIALPTTIGFARNVIVVASADIVIALPGSHGTSSEISYAIVYKRPVIDLGGWKRKEMIKVKNLTEAKAKLKQLMKNVRSEEILSTVHGRRVMV